MRDRELFRLLISGKGSALAFADSFVTTAVQHLMVWQIAEPAELYRRVFAMLF